MNDNVETFQSFLTTEIGESNVVWIAINLVLAAVLGYWIGRFYIRYGTSLSNRRAFANNFVLLAMTTALIIALIQSNVVLSLGMIGALSIVRFRSAIKEPEELSYLFLSIAVGLGLGANQQAVTIGGLAIILLVLRMKVRIDKGVPAGSEQNLYVTVNTERPEVLSTQTLTTLLEGSCSLHRLKRLDQSKGSTEVCYLVEPKDANSMGVFEAELRKLDEQVSFSLLDTRGGMMGAG